MRQAKLAYIAETSSKVQRRPLKHGADKCANKNENRAKKLKVELDERHKSEAEHTIVSVKVPKRERCPAVGGRNSQRTDILSKKTSKYSLSCIYVPLFINALVLSIVTTI